MAEELCFKLKNVFLKLFNAFKSLTGLIIILVLYSVIGAVIFVHIEAPYEQQLAEEYKTNSLGSKHSQLIRFLNNLTVALNNPEFSSLRNESQALVVQYEEEAKQSEPRKVWDFWKAMFFCGTIYTTIGYGNIYPKTDIGKIVTILYAVFGIPLAMKCLAEIGKKLSLLLRFLYVRIKRFFRKRIGKGSKYNVQDKQIVRLVSPEINISKNNETQIQTVNLEIQDVKPEIQNTKPEIHDMKPEKHVFESDDTDDSLPVAVPVFILVIYVLLGGSMYTAWEEWGYLDSFYFVFISISTVGFGDITPAHTKFFIITFIYVFVGLSLVAMCISILIEIYIVSLKAAVHKMSSVKYNVKNKWNVRSARRKSM